MVSSPGSSSQITRQQFARVLRERFLAEAVQAMMDIGGVVQEQLTALMDEPATARESQDRRDVWMAYKKCRPLWVESTKTVWRECLEPPAARKPLSTEPAGLQLVGTEVVENKILASRLVMAVMDKVSGQYEDLRLRLRHLEGMDELPGNDLLRPEVLVLLMVEQWAKSGMPADSWSMVNEAVQKLLIERLKDAYANANAVLIKKGIMPTIELKDRVKSPVRGSGSPPRARTVSGSSTTQQELQGGQGPHDASGRNGTGHSARPGYSEPEPSGPYGGAEVSAPQSDNGHTGGRPGWWGNQNVQQAGDVAAPALGSRNGSAAATPFWKQPSGIQNGIASGHSAADETRMMTAVTPMARARSRAQGVMGQIRRLFASHVGADFDKTEHQQASPALAAAMAPAPTGKQGTFASGGTLYEDYSPEGIARVAGDLREKTAELKKKAETKGEKATIEIVALMFQAILAEERIPPGIRVWFARLQMPVLRMALEDPDFLGTTTHPARLLIDRLGSCVMGFDSTGVQGMAMETEVKRIVQVIEQYPETGKKVYQVVYEEFQKFLSKFLTEKESTQKVVSVAQQVEQRETLAIQYTIEMRNMLKDMPVRDEIREFLFKVWAEVLAVAAVRKGPQHRDTLTLKKSASDLVWAASAKPNRADRARVIQDLPNLLLRLRSGMTLLAMAPSDQDARIKAVSDTLADAFLSKTQAIPQEQIDAMALRLGNLEDFVSENGTGDLPLDAESIEMMLGIDASTIEVVGNGGSKPTAAMLAWAQELQLGAWFTLDHSNQITQVQFVWRSDRKHLNLFASGSGKSYLIQSGRLAAYLQAGLLLPQEEEALTVRATRDALSKIEANPERLMN